MHSVPIPEQKDIKLLISCEVILQPPDSPQKGTVWMKQAISMRHWKFTYVPKPLIINYYSKTKRYFIKQCAIPRRLPYKVGIARSFYVLLFTVQYSKLRDTNLTEASELSKS